MHANETNKQARNMGAHAPMGKIVFIHSINVKLLRSEAAAESFAGYTPSLLQNSAPD